MLANKIKKLTIRQLCGNLFSGGVNKVISIMLPNIDMCLSFGGFIAGMWDYFSDRKLNRKVVIRI